MLVSTAARQRAHSDRARSGSIDAAHCHPSSSCAYCEQEGHLATHLLADYFSILLNRLRSFVVIIG